MVRLSSVYSAATVAYADIFDYPLSAEELRLWSIKKSVASFDVLRHKYFFLKGRESLVRLRKKRRAASMKKWHIAQKVAAWLRFVPTIQLVGVTGGLAMNNAGEEDDIDLFIISRSHTMWTTRALAFFLVSILGRRRKPEETNVRNTVCLNMFMSENSLAIDRKERDLFAAHEVLQMVPLWEREGVYAKFLASNRWVREFLPNAWIDKQKALSTKHKINSKSKFYFEFGILCLKFLEQPMRLLQLWYMKRRRTTEVVSDSVLRFHPRDARAWVKEELRRRLDVLDIPLDKIFYRG